MTTPIFRDYVLMPKDATEKMWLATNVSSMSSDHGEQRHAAARSYYRHMLSARPTAELEAAVEAVIEAADELLREIIHTHPEDNFGRCLACNKGGYPIKHMDGCEAVNLQQARRALDALMETKG